MPPDQTRTWQTACPSTSAALWGSQTNTMMIEGGHMVVWEGGPLWAPHNASRANVSERLVRENRRTSAFRRHLQKPTSAFLTGSPFFWGRKEGGLHARAADNEDFGTRPSRLLQKPAPRTEAACRGLQKVNRKTVLQRGDGQASQTLGRILVSHPAKRPRSIPERSTTRHACADLMRCFAHFPPVTERHNMTT